MSGIRTHDHDVSQHIESTSGHTRKLSRAPHTHTHTQYQICCGFEVLKPTQSLE